MYVYNELGKEKVTNLLIDIIIHFTGKRCIVLQIRTNQEKLAKFISNYAVIFFIFQLVQKT